MMQTNQVRQYGFTKIFRYLPVFTIFIFRYFPSARFAMAIAVLGVILEYATLSVMLPLAIPGCISVALFAFFASWNEFLAALILMNDQTKYTLPIMLTLLNSKLYGQIDWGLMQSGVIVTMIPSIILFLTLQRYYVQGLMAGGVKA